MARDGHRYLLTRILEWHGAIRLLRQVYLSALQL